MPVELSSEERVGLMEVRQSFGISRYIVVDDWRVTPLVVVIVLSVKSVGIDRLNHIIGFG